MCIDIMYIYAVYILYIYIYIYIKVNYAINIIYEKIRLVYTKKPLF